jgi:hypothetical protein
MQSLLSVRRALATQTALKRVLFVGRQANLAVVGSCRVATKNHLFLKNPTINQSIHRN